MHDHQMALPASLIASVIGLGIAPALASRLDVVVDAPLPLPRSLLPSRALDRELKLYRFWLRRRSSCLSPLGCKSSHAFRSAEHQVLKQHHEEPGA